MPCANAVMATNLFKLGHYYANTNWINLPQEMLSSKDAATVLSWHTNLFKNLESWSKQGQYNDQVYTAFKAVYYRTLAHLEDELATKGIKGDAATALSVSVIKILIGEDLDGFN